ncbi:MAG TPA: adenylate kinase [Chloroflexi bacterium]|nr:adenylate kinase [Chloroflexota bacterium]HBY07947.1 adenylate kinase [Chloroflexota bacterium]
MSRFIVLLGPPGAGKGTQAKLVSGKLNMPHISSGDIFRENQKNKTELGNLAEGYISRGELVPDDVTIAMIKERLSRPDCVQGALLDGFPRTDAQAEALDEMLNDLDGQVIAVPYIKVAEEILIERLTGRWTCPTCSRVYHEKFNPPQNAGICDYDTTELYQRNDDKAETVTRRIRVYLEQTQPLIDYYQNKGILLEIDGAQGIDMVSADLMSALPQE